MTAHHCGATWSGVKAEHCCACHETFSGTTAGDKHRTGDHAVSSGPTRRRCLTPDEMLAKGMTVTTNAQGTPIWGTGRTQERPFYASPLGSDGIWDAGWGVVSPARKEARKSEVSA